MTGFFILICFIFTWSKDWIEVYGFENDFVEDLRELYLRLKVLLLLANFGSETTDVYRRCIVVLAVG